MLPIFLPFWIVSNSIFLCFSCALKMLGFLSDFGSLANLWLASGPWPSFGIGPSKLHDEIGSLLIGRRLKWALHSCQSVRLKQLNINIHERTSHKIDSHDPIHSIRIHNPYWNEMMRAKCNLVSKYPHGSMLAHVSRNFQTNWFWLFDILCRLRSNQTPTDFVW